MEKVSDKMKAVTDAEFHEELPAACVDVVIGMDVLWESGVSDAAWQKTSEHFEKCECCAKLFQVLQDLEVYRPDDPS